MVWLRAEFDFLQNGIIKTSGDALEALLRIFIVFIVCVEPTSSPS
jgi:hypothetical protein